MAETVIRAGDSPLTLINVFSVDPARQDELVALLTDATEKLMKPRPGFVSANIHAGLDGTTVVNYAQWRSREDFEAMLADAEVGVHFREISAVATADPRLFTVVSVHHS
jgi:quinol monooxygenase YgiN